MSTLFIALRESGILLLGCLLTTIVAYLLSDGQPQPKMMPFAHPLAAIFIPILVCLLRAGFVRGPSAGASKARSVMYQVSIAVALILLLLFEMGVGLFVGARGIPLFAWLIVAAFGMLYVFFFCLADAIDPRPELELIQNPFGRDNRE